MDKSSSSGEGQKDVSACQSKVGSFRLTKWDRIRLSTDFRRIIKEGARYRTPNFQLRLLRNPLGRTRLGLVVGRKAGNACARNRIKRRLREYFRLNRGKIPPETDMVFIALKGAATLDTCRLMSELDEFIRTKF